MRVSPWWLVVWLGCADKGGSDSASGDAGVADGGAGDGGVADGGGSDGDRPEGQYFPDGSAWYEDSSAAAVDPRSDAVIDWLNGQGWGLGRFQIDFSLVVVAADASTTRLEFTPTDDFYSPDCDRDPVPVPGDAVIEGETGTACASDGDCHLLVAEWETGLLYEMWRADIRGDTFRGGCLAVWDMNHSYGPDGRGDQCTSADAAGYPIAPLAPTADQVASGDIGHALRFILPNESIRAGEFVHPATHSTGSASGGPDAPPYGAHLRLRADFDLASLPNEASRTVARALQTYGMFLADGGNVALTFQADTFSTAKWADLMESRDLEDIRPSDFELLELPDSIALTYDCVRVAR